MSTTSLVLLEDVVGRAGTSLGHVRGWTDKLRIGIQSDWAGRPVLAESDARRVLEEIQRAGLENAQLHRDFELYEADWRRRQHAAGETAFERFLVEALGQQRSAGFGTGYAFVGNLDRMPIGGAVFSSANDVAETARADFEKREPRKNFDSFERTWKKGRKKR